MNRLVMAILCTSLAAGAAVTAVHSTSTDPAPRASGLDLAGADRNVRPQDDLFRYMNGEWLRTTQIPADRSNYGAFTMLDDKAQADLRAIIEEAAAKPQRAPGSDEQKVGDFYKSFMDTARVDALGLKPLQAELARIDAIADRAALNRYLGESQFVGLSHPVGLYIAQDEKNTTAYIPIVVQSGLTLPDRDYYLKSEDKYAKIRDAYAAYIARMAQLAGISDPAGTAKRVLALETRLAEAQWTRVQNRDAVATYNKHTLASANELTPGFDWKAFFAAAGIATPDFIVTQPSYFAGLSRALAEIPLKDWREYLKFKLVNDYAPYLSAAFVDAHFDMHGRTLKGIEENRPRWKRAVDALDNTMGEIAGRLYVERHFKPEAKRRMDELVRNLIRAYEISIDELDWMSPATRAQARAKLAKFTVKIGYPDKWKDYSALEIKADELVGNLLRSAAVEQRRGIAKLGKPIDRTEWLMTPQTVNAYYYPPMNEIVFPAAILQPPFFNATADDAANYGGIGAVIGHEISHGFDDQGRRYDGDGNLRDWWTADDEKRFKERTAALVAQYGAFNPIDDQHVNGELTLGENIGDLSGLAVAYKAYQLSLDGKPAPTIDGLTGEQRFFLGWAQVWRRKYRDEELRVRLLTDPHSPSEYRANGVVTNMSEFHEAFGLKPGDKLYRPAEQRVEIW
ncbi:MAG TPA: M13-type metalloendopeptidase [Steroidobacteraceae bacterium]|nr:M13-type metalloendopeptidase [Steroidobacteraceae bacterium]